MLENVKDFTNRHKCEGWSVTKLFLSQIRIKWNYFFIKSWQYCLEKQWCLGLYKHLISIRGNILINWSNNKGQNNTVALVSFTEMWSLKLHSYCHLTEFSRIDLFKSQGQRVIKAKSFPWPLLSAVNHQWVNRWTAFNGLKIQLQTYKKNSWHLENTMQM